MAFALHSFSSENSNEFPHNHRTTLKLKPFHKRFELAESFSDLPDQELEVLWRRPGRSGRAQASPTCPSAASLTAVHAPNRQAGTSCRRGAVAGLVRSTALRAEALRLSIDVVRGVKGRRHLLRGATTATNFTKTRFLSQSQHGNQSTRVITSIAEMRERMFCRFSSRPLSSS